MTPHDFTLHPSFVLSRHCWQNSFSSKGKSSETASKEHPYVLHSLISGSDDVKDPLNKESLSSSFLIRSCSHVNNSISLSVNVASEGGGYTYLSGDGYLGSIGEVSAVVRKGGE